jgi:hypothetical protein
VAPRRPLRTDAHIVDAAELRASAAKRPSVIVTKVIRLSAMALVDLHSDRLPARFASFVARQQAAAVYRTRGRAPAVGEAARPS